MLRTGFLTTRLLSIAAAFLLLTIGLITGGCGSSGNNIGLENTVSGLVRDSAAGDAVVAGATVVIGGASATTAADGTFTIRKASLGSTTATVTAPGQAAQTIGFQPAVGVGTLNGLILTLNIGQIRGKVLLANQPVSGALVTEEGTGFSVTTASDGTFLLESIPAGATSISAVAPTATATKTLTVVNGLNDVGNIVLVVDTNTNPPGPPAATLLGKITLSDQPTAGAAAGTNVFLLQNGVQIDQKVADSSGNYSFYALPGSGYSVLARKNAYGDAVSDVFAITNTAASVSKDLTLSPL